MQLGRFTAQFLTVAMVCLAQSDNFEFFEKNVRPLLVAQCQGCHGAAANPAAGLRMDSREGLLKGGSRGPAITLGKPAESLLLSVVRHTAGNLKMPPAGKLKDADIAVLTEWIAMDAPWGTAAAQKQAEKKFWAFVPPVASSAPLTKNQSWAKSPVDTLLLRALEAKGLRPAPQADKRTLLRRATYDLTGLPPTQAEMQAFLKDNAADAFEKVVDRLLGSPRYGERWARHWMDVARYADSNGLDENLVYKNAFRYRDYVIQAFNKDKPYDQFIHEQLAGDLLPKTDDLATTFERWTATGFLTLGAKMLAEDDPVKMEMDIIDEQLDTTARAFLGLTVGCARCHDHKFDPIPTADYYSLAGIFKSTKTMENFKVVAKWHEYVLRPQDDRDKLEAHEAKIEAKKNEISKIKKANDDTLIDAAISKAGAYLMASYDVMQSQRIVLKPTQSSPSAIIRESASFDKGNVPRPLQKKKANVEKETKAPYFAEYIIDVPKAGLYQIDMLDEEKGAGTADLHINGALIKRGAEPVQNREASPDAGGWTVSGIFPLVAGKNTLRLEHKSRFPYFDQILVAPNTSKDIPQSSVQIANKYAINPSFIEQMVDHLKRSDAAPASALYAWEVFGSNKPLSAWDSAVAKLFNQRPATRDALAERYQALIQQAKQQWLALPADARKKEETKLNEPGLDALRQLLYEKFGPFAAPDDARRYYPEAVKTQFALLDAELKAFESATPDYPRAMGVKEAEKIEDLPIHTRGSHWTLGKVVPRGFLSVIDTKPQMIPPNTSGRLELAQWMTRKDNPLTSRVMVNRIWRWHFGKGIVPSVDNFGRLGEKPSNQPLLDYLAMQFIERDWSIKSMHRLIMLSSAYQMSSAYDEKAAEVDPENNLMWRSNRRRLEAEAIRDAVMVSSGDINFNASGSILQYKDRQYVANTSKGGNVDYDRNIRAVYIPVVRSSLYDVFRAFDLPDPSMSNGDRDSTVVAPQALFMMNGSVVLKHSHTMAEMLLKLDTDDQERIRLAYERALSRPPSGKEIDQALTFINHIEKTIAGREPDPAKRHVNAWQSFCKSLLAANEFIYLD